MDKETFNKLLANISNYLEERKKELEENDLIIDFDEEREEVYVYLWKNLYVFDQQGYRIFEELWAKGVLMPNAEGYLSVKDNEWNDLIPVHRYLRLKEVEKLAEKLGCPEKDIHVHHMDKERQNNCLDNLEVLHKDEHAKKHGFDTWEEYQEWREKSPL